MSHYLKKLSGFLFYALGSSYFVAYMLHYNKIGGELPMWWINVADLPTALAAMLYGGLSFQQSITKDHPTLLHLGLVWIPLLVIFYGIVILNFWDVFGFPSEEGQSLGSVWITVLLLVLATSGIGYLAQKKLFH